MPDTLLSLDEMRERFERSHAEAQEVIAESRWLRLKSRELADRLRRETSKPTKAKNQVFELNGTCLVEMAGDRHAIENYRVVRRVDSSAYHFTNTFSVLEIVFSSRCMPLIASNLPRDAARSVHPICDHENP